MKPSVSLTLGDQKNLIDLTSDETNEIRDKEQDEEQKKQVYLSSERSYQKTRPLYSIVQEKYLNEELRDQANLKYNNGPSEFSIQKKTCKINPPISLTISNINYQHQLVFKLK